MHMTMMRNALLFIALLTTPLLAQEDLLDLLGEEPDGPQYTIASFKTTRVINGHSLENTAHGVLDFKVGHRFGEINGGANEFFGLDNATTRLGFDYGATDRLMIGIGRSSYQKTVDGFAKYKFLQQCDEGCAMPVTLALVAASSINTTQTSDFWPDTTKEYYFTHRMAYSFQLIVGRKFSERLSFQLNPGLVHRNLVEDTSVKNDVMHISGAGRVKLSKRVALNAEYFYVLPDQIAEEFHNSLSLGFDIETGGHVFQLHFTNSRGQFERAYITETTGEWGDGDIHFGFNISRVFTVHRPKPKEI
ncbi:MAG: hypothetical protein KDC00_04355 [Flavobacteriales bacterium]|nr:hypothetical protein [Flavobacteriales bacterium]